MVRGPPASPAAPCRTVRAVLPHTALRHRSPRGMRCPPTDRAAEPVHPERLEPGGREPTAPVAAGEPVLVAGEERQPLVHVAVDDVELARRMSVAEVVAPAAQHAVETTDDVVDGVADPAAGGEV